MCCPKWNIPLRIKFSVRSLVIAVSLFCISFGQWAYVKNKHNAAYRYLKSRGVGLPVSIEEPFGPNFFYISDAEVPPNGFFSRWFVHLFCIEGAGRAYVEHTQLEKDEWQKFGDLVGLRVIDMTDVKLRPSAIENLRECKSLRHLILAWCELDSDAVEALSRLSQLETLDLYDTNIECADVAFLVQKLPNTEVKSNCPDHASRDGNPHS